MQSSSQSAPLCAPVSQGLLSAAAAIALIFCTALFSSQPVRAERTLTVADISLALQGSPQAASSEQSKNSGHFATDQAYSALAAFASEIAGTPTSRVHSNVADSMDDPTFAALREFAGKLAPAKLQSVKNQPQLAEADNALDALRDFLRNGAASPPSSETTKSGPIAGGTDRSKAPVEASFVGAKVCMTCHASHAEAFSKTLMGRIAKTQPGKFDCENCHGPGSAHVKAGGGRGVGGIISFRPEDRTRTAEENNTICLNCHEKGDRKLWHGSTHDERGLMCTNCHTVMKNVSRKHQLKTEFQPDTCFQCHKNKRAEMWRSSHIPVREGKLVCTDCHNPHGSYSESLLKKATVNDTCFQCHAEKRGPFLWEHPPVRESCLNCHDPHGSNNDFLLKVSRPRLCQQCHSGGQHNSNPRNPAVSLYAQGRECQNCHSNHHGSNNPAGARFMR